MANSSVAPATIIRSSSPEAPEKDLLAREEPLEIRLEYGPAGDRNEMRLAVTMRTPGHDEDLAAGFLFTEGIIQSPGDIVSVRPCAQLSSEERENVLKVFLSPSLSLEPESLQRNFYTTSSCGVCGKSSLEAVRVHCVKVTAGTRVPAGVVHRAPDTLREAQQVFQYTGGLHAAGLFSSSGELLRMREDVGRHNALDKLIGAEWAAENRMHDALLVLSGRASFELVQKAARAGIPVVAAVGAPSSLAVELAEEMGITLLGFVRKKTFNCYTHAERIEFT